MAINDDWKSTMCAETYTRLGTGAPASNDILYFSSNSSRLKNIEVLPAKRGVASCLCFQSENNRQSRLFGHFVITGKRPMINAHQTAKQ